MSKSTAEYVAAEARAEMGRQSRSNQWLAEATGKTEIWVSRHLRNVNDWSVDDLVVVAEALGISPLQLLPVKADAR